MTARGSRRLERQSLALAVGSVLALGSGCTLSTESTVDSRPVATSDSVSPAQDQATTSYRQHVQRLLDTGHARLPRLPRLRSRLPRAVPDRVDDLPSLLTDPPGRAVLTFHPPEGFDDPAGWASETLLFYGSDRRWRSLRMGELGLPAQAWPGADTYGAGSLSPDGRWWAGRSTP